LTPAPAIAYYDRVQGLNGRQIFAVAYGLERARLRPFPCLSVDVGHVLVACCDRTAD
jgi:hypothetical protein